MENTQVNQIAIVAAENLTRRLNRLIAPIPLLTSVVVGRNEPIITLDKPFTPMEDNKEESKCFQVYTEKQRDGSITLMMMEQLGNEGNEISYSSVIDYIEAYELPDDTNGELKENFARHFIGAAGIDYDQLKSDMLTLTIKQFILSLPPEIAHELSYDYDIQCWIEESKSKVTEE